MAAAAPPFVGDVPTSATSSDAALSAAFASVDSAAATPSNPSTELAPAAPSPGVTPGTTAPDTSVVQAPAPGVSVPIPEAALDLAQGTDPDSVDAEGKRHFYTVPKSNRLQQESKAWRAIQEFFPNATVEEIKTAVEKANAAEQMMLKYHESEHNGAALDELLLPFIENDNPKAFGLMALRMVGKLHQINPEALNYIRNEFNKGLIEWLKGRARSTMDEKERMEQVGTVQRLQMALYNGQFEKTADILKGIAVDPNEAARRDLEQRNRQLNEREAANRRADDERWTNFCNSQEESGVQGEIDAILAPIKDKYAPEDIQDARDRLRRAVATYEVEHPEGGVRYNNLRGQANLQRSEESVKTVVGYRRNIARQVALANAKAILERLSIAAMQRNQAAHDKATNRPNEASPNGVAPSVSNGVNFDAVLKSKTVDEAWKQMGW